MALPLKISSDSMLPLLCATLPEAATGLREDAMPRQKAAKPRKDTTMMTLRLPTPLYQRVVGMAEQGMRPVNSQIILLILQALGEAAGLEK